MLKYKTQGYRKLVAMLVSILAIMIVLYTSDLEDQELAQTAVWGVVSIGTAYITGNLIKHGMGMMSHRRGNQSQDDAEY
jgi:hypothetical protein